MSVKKSIGINASISEVASSLPSIRPFLARILQNKTFCAALLLNSIRLPLKQTIYFDYNATTPLDPRVREAMLPYFGAVFGNPSSIHHVGRKARALLDDARHQMATMWKCKPSEVVFTSGGTESTNLALMGVSRQMRSKGKHIITSSVEHHAVLHCVDYLEKNEGFEVTRLPVDSFGRVSVEDVSLAIREDTILVSIMAANNEIGTIQPVAEIGSLCRDRSVLFHTDAVQWFGKEPFSDIGHFNADLVSACSHKFHGPKGVGALFIKSPLLPDPLLFGGGHENERRAGTENLAGIIGFAEAFRLNALTPAFAKEPLVRLTDRLFTFLDAFDGVTIRGCRANCLSNTVGFTVADSDSMIFLANLDMAGICASSGSACSAGSLEPSHVISALGVPSHKPEAFIRFSLGNASTDAETDAVIESLPEIISRSRNS